MQRADVWVFEPEGFIVIAANWILFAHGSACRQPLGGCVEDLKCNLTTQFVHSVRVNTKNYFMFDCILLCSLRIIYWVKKIPGTARVI